MDDKATQARTTARAQEAQARYEVSGTPTFVVDGQVVYSGEYPWDHIKPMLDDKLAKSPDRGRKGPRIEGCPPVCQKQAEPDAEPLS